MSYSHTNFYGDYNYPQSYQAPPYSQPYAQAPAYNQSFVQPPPYNQLYSQDQSLPYAVPVNNPMATPPSSDSLDYARPQTWRNMPQRQSSSGSRPPSTKIDVTPRTTRSSSNASTDSVTPSPFSDVAMTANASVATTAMPTAASNDSERGSITSATSSATRSSVDAAVETMWEARRAREKAEEEADQKLIDAVCKASLAEYNERERALKAYDSETSQRTLEHQSSSVALQQARSEAEQRKRAAMQTVIDSKTRAKQMSEKAREATSMYEQKNAERVAKQAELEALKLREAQEAELRAVQIRKEEAMRKRTEAEQKAREAREKAEAMRREAFQAASKVRAHSRRQIETQLSQEEAQRQQELQRKLDEIERNKALARERKEAAAKKAEEARRRAEELRAKAEQAKLLLKSNTPTTSA